MLASLLHNSSSDFERISSDLKTQSSVQRKPLFNISLRDAPKRFLEIIVLIVREMRNSCLSHFLFTLSWITVHVQKGPPPQKRGTFKSPGSFLMKQNKPPNQHPVLLKHSRKICKIPIFLDWSVKWYKFLSPHRNHRENRL